jgi:hypothetical protein
MKEVGVLVDTKGKPIYWHLPQGSTSGSLPECPDFWDVIWENRSKIFGFAHSHPGSGIPGASYEDITTFAPIESALGRRLIWWITSSDTLVHYIWEGPKEYTYRRYSNFVDPEGFNWLNELRQRSEY